MKRKKILNKRILIIIIFFIAVQIANSQLHYISPGVGFAWNLHGEFVFSPKISVGVLEDRGQFYNLTIGHSSTYGEMTNRNYFVEAQLGQITETMGNNKSQIFYGGGIGITVPSNRSGSKVTFRTSVFTGFLVFLNATILFNDTTQAELGGQVVVPIPLQRLSM